MQPALVAATGPPPDGAPAPRTVRGAGTETDSVGAAVPFDLLLQLNLLPPGLPPGQALPSSGKPLPPAVPGSGAPVPSLLASSAGANDGVLLPPAVAAALEAARADAAAAASAAAETLEAPAGEAGTGGKPASQAPVAGGARASFDLAATPALTQSLPTASAGSPTNARSAAEQAAQAAAPGALASPAPVVAGEGGAMTRARASGRGAERIAALQVRVDSTTADADAPSLEPTAAAAKPAAPAPVTPSLRESLAATDSTPAPAHADGPAATSSVAHAAGQHGPATTSTAGVSTAAASTSLDSRDALDTTTARWQDALASRVHAMLDHGVDEARIKLNPPQLGALDIKISVHDDKTFVQLVASTSAARDELSQSLPRLRDLLAAGGLDLAGASVSGGRDEQAAPQHSGARSGAEPFVASVRALAGAEGAAASFMRAPHARSQIDLYA